MIHLIHGIRTAPGKSNVPKLIPYLELVDEVVYPDYGFIEAIETRRVNPIICGTMTPYIKPNDVLVGHSNGCAVILDMLEAGVKAHGIVFINGALKQDFVLPACVKYCSVYFNVGDDITEVARFAENLPVSPVDTNWGSLGHGGYIGFDPRVANINCGAVATAPAGLPLVNGHSDIFSDINLPKWGPYIAGRIKEEL